MPVRKTVIPVSLGFSLIELMVVLVIVAIIAAIALPSYQSRVQESRRTAAKTALMDLASREESYYSLNNTYASQLSALNYGNVSSNTVAVPSSSQNYYTLAISSVNNSGTPPTFVLTATPTPGSVQAGDSCQTYQLGSSGTQSNIGNTASGCW